MSAASLGRVIQHLLHQGPDRTEISLCVIRLWLLSQKEMWWCVSVCVSMWFCILLYRDVYFFTCAHFPSQPSSCGGIDCSVSARYWLIISDSCDIHSYYSPLRNCFQSFLEVEPEKNNTYEMISGFNFNGNCSLFPYSIIFLGNNSWVPSLREKPSPNKQKIKFVLMW